MCRNVLRRDSSLPSEPEPGYFFRLDNACVLHTCRCGPLRPCIRPERPVLREGVLMFTGATQSFARPTQLPATRPPHLPRQIGLSAERIHHTSCLGQPSPHLARTGRRFFWDGPAAPSLPGRWSSRKKPRGSSAGRRTNYQYCLRPQAARPHHR